MSSIESRYDMPDYMLGNLQQTQQSAGLSQQNTQSLLRSEGDASSFSNYAQRLSEIDQELQQTDNASAREGFRNMVQSFAENPGQAELDSFVQASSDMEQQEREEFASTAQNVQEQGGSELMREWSNQASRIYNQDSQAGSQFVQASSHVLELSQNEQNEAEVAQENLSSFLEISSRAEQSRDNQSSLQQFLDEVQSSADSEELQGVYNNYYQNLTDAV
ncbi:MAG: hypothetical protein R6U22_02550 [Desulfohalobiaceae bacterium]